MEVVENLDHSLPTINIIPNFLSNDEMLAVREYLNSADWKIQTSYIGDTPFFKYRDGFLYHKVENHNDFFWKVIADKIRQKFNFDNQIERVYFNGQWFGRDGKFHIDKCDKTVLIYITDWESDWGGFTHFTYNGDHAVVPPITNSAICFPGNVTHKAYSFSQQNAPMRITLAYKFLFND